MDELTKTIERTAILAKARELVDPDARIAADVLTADSGPGKYEGVSDPMMCEALNILVGNGFADREMGAIDEAGFFARVGHYVFTEDAQGFCDCTEFDSPDEAEAKIEEWEREIYDEDGEMIER